MKLTRNVFMLVLAICLVAVLPTTTNASTLTPKLRIESSLFVTPAGEPQPYINKDNRTMGSVRLVANALGVHDDDISWDNDTQTATLKKDERIVQVTVGKKEISVNGQVVVMDTVAENKQDRVFIPVRFIAEALGFYIDYDNATSTVLISSVPFEDKTKKNIEDALGLTVIESFPFNLNAGGLDFTINSMTFIDAASKEGKALNKKYDIREVEALKSRVYTKAYITPVEVTIKNESKKTIYYDFYHLDSLIDIRTAKGNTVYPAFSQIKENYTYNNTEFLHDIELKAGESVTGTMYFVFRDVVPYEYLSIGINNHGVEFKSKRVAEKR